LTDIGQPDYYYVRERTSGNQEQLCALQLMQMKFMLWNQQSFKVRTFRELVMPLFMPRCRNKVMHTELSSMSLFIIDRTPSLVLGHRGK